MAKPRPPGRGSRVTSSSRWTRATGRASGARSSTRSGPSSGHSLKGVPGCARYMFSTAKMMPAPLRTDALDEGLGVGDLPAQRRVDDDHVGAQTGGRLGGPFQACPRSLLLLPCVTSRQGAWMAITGTWRGSRAAPRPVDVGGQRVDPDHQLNTVPAGARRRSRNRRPWTRDRRMRWTARTLAGLRAASVWWLVCSPNQNSRPAHADAAAHTGRVPRVSKVDVEIRTLPATWVEFVDPADADQALR